MYLTKKQEAKQEAEIQRYQDSLKRGSPMPTPTPRHDWIVQKATAHPERWHVIGPNGGCMVSLTCKRMAEQVVREHNAHAALVEALKTLLADMQAGYRDTHGDVDYDGIEMAQAALRLVGEET